jgi:hypothetical protein
MMPHGTTFNGDATSVAVDSQDLVYVFNRGPIPLIVFDRAGNLVSSWGEGEFDRPHAIAVDSDDAIYVVDTGGHFIQKRTTEGKTLLTIGERGNPTTFHSGEPFNAPTDVVIHPVTRDIFVSDGYGNSRVHRFDADGKHITSWGDPGTENGQFSLPHGIDLVDDDLLVICDRENFRLQFFTTNGEFVEQQHVHHPSAVRRCHVDGFLFVAELGTPMQHGVPNIGCRVSVRTAEGDLVGRLGSALPGFAPDELFAPHGVAVDSHGDVYVAEVSYTYLTGLGLLRREAPPGELISLRKWERIRESGS